MPLILQVSGKPRFPLTDAEKSWMDLFSASLGVGGIAKIEGPEPLIGSSQRKTVFCADAR
jgi:hypothetical protein